MKDDPKRNNTNTTKMNKLIKTMVAWNCPTSYSGQSILAPMQLHLLFRHQRQYERKLSVHKNNYNFEIIMFNELAFWISTALALVYMCFTAVERLPFHVS